MATNLSKYFRLKFALIPKKPDNNMLRNVTFKVFKIENVPPFKNDPDKKTELKARAVETPDLFGGNETHRWLIGKEGGLGVGWAVGV